MFAAHGLPNQGAIDVGRQQSQPMSLMTIDASLAQARGNNNQLASKQPGTSATNETNLLTIRILEASERKLKLIKELLSPDEFNKALESGLFGIDDLKSFDGDDNNDSNAGFKSERSHFLNCSKTRLTSVPPLICDRNHANEYNLNESIQLRSSRSDTNLKLSSLQGQQTNLVQENLIRRRNAIKFFLGNQADCLMVEPQTSDTNNVNNATVTALNGLNKTNGSDLAIELRSGYYINTTEICQSNEKMMKYFQFSLIDRLTGLLGLMGLTLSSWFDCSSLINLSDPSDNDNLQTKNDYIDREHKQFNCLPYTRDANLSKFRARLNGDAGGGQYDKLARQLAPKPAEIGSKLSIRTKQTVASQQSNEIPSISAALMSNEKSKMSKSPMVGQFNRVELQSSVEFAQSDAKFLVFDPIIEQSTSSKSHKVQTNGSENQLCSKANSMLDSFKLLVKLESLVLIKSDLLSNEQCIAIKLFRLEKLLAKFRDVFDELTREFNICIQINLNNDESDQQKQKQKNLMRLCKLAELRMKFYEKFLIKQQELLATWEELKSIRIEQEYVSTGFLIEQSSSQLADESLAGVLLDKLIEQTESKLITHGNDSGLIDFLVQLKQFEKSLQIKQIIVLKHDKSISSHQYPQAELRRKQALIDWFGSLQLQLSIRQNTGQRFCLTLKDIMNAPEVGQPLLELSNGSIGLNLSGSSCAFDDLIGQQDEADIRLELYQLCNWWQPHMASRKLLATANLSLNDDCSKQSVCLILSSRKTSDDQSNKDSCPAIEFELNFSIHCRRSVCFGRSPLLSPSLRQSIDNYYRMCFNVKHPFEDTLSKLAQLVNRINWPIIKRTTGLESRFFLIDPFVNDELSTNGQELTNGTRLALLAWRWKTGPTGKRQIVYLNERENFQHWQALLLAKADNNYHQQMSSINEQFIKTKSSSLKSPLTGHKLIESLRAQAGEHLRQLDHLLALKISQGREMQHHADGPHSMDPSKGGEYQIFKAKQLLREPKLASFQMMQMATLTRTIRSLVPQPGVARRPLKPRRSRQQPQDGGRGAAARLSDRLTATLWPWSGHAMHQVLGMSSGQPGGETQWHQLATRLHQTGAASLPLRLVVSIQRAFNVPLRVVCHYHQHQLQSSTRSVSPYFSTNTPSPLPASGTTAPISYLMPASTYVEAVFQRQQLASSLAQGPSPAWNETLFFPIDLGAQSNGQQAQTCSSLADEFLQLNLYDRKCYAASTSANAGLDSNAPITTLDYQQPTLGHSLTSTNGNQSNQEPGFMGHHQVTNQPPISRLNSVTSQRVERQLIGSLRIPLSALILIGGRIQGSFALSQPLLLADEYQFHSSDLLMSTQSINDQYSAKNSLGMMINQQPETYLSLFVTLDPISSSLTSSLELISNGTCLLPLDSVEDQWVLEYTRVWQQILGKQANNWRSSSGLQSSTLKVTSGRLPGHNSTLKRPSSQARRHIRALVISDELQYCLACRYLGASEPPSDMMDHLNECLDHHQDHHELRNHIQMSHLARFVSLISPLKYGFIGRNLGSLAQSLWFKGNQLIGQQLGGPEEKAILLCNYFLHLGQCSGLLLGDSLPLGRCLFVIVWHQHEQLLQNQLQLQVNELLDSINRVNRPDSTDHKAGFSGSRWSSRAPILSSCDFVSKLPLLISSRTIQIWDPNTGKCHHLTQTRGDQSVPLISVGSIITMDNVYANIQTTESPLDTNYDIRLRQFWFPLFGPSGTTNFQPQQHQSEASNLRESLQKVSTTSSWRKQIAQLEQIRKLIVQPLISRRISAASTRYNYEKSWNNQECEQLRDIIERAIKSHLLAWRQNRPTYFNRTLARLIAEKLATFELTPEQLSRQLKLSQSNQQDDEPTIRPVRINVGTPIQADWRSQLAELIRGDLIILGSHSASSLNNPLINSSNNNIYQNSNQFNANNIVSDRQVVSWPINMPFTSIKAILDALYASGIHDADLVFNDYSSGHNDSASGQTIPPLNTQMLVACHICAYPANVLSVWLYVGALINRPKNHNLI